MYSILQHDVTGLADPRKAHLFGLGRCATKAKALVGRPSDVDERLRLLSVWERYRRRRCLPLIVCRSADWGLHTRTSTCKPLLGSRCDGKASVLPLPDLSESGHALPARGARDDGCSAPRAAALRVRRVSMGVLLLREGRSRGVMVIHPGLLSPAGVRTRLTGLPPWIARVR